jgi:uncharacterized protein involved in outer membrane biogenesis
MAHVRVRPWHYFVSALAVAIVILVAVWNWDWFIPCIERIASAKLGRPIILQHLHVRIARNPVLEADGIVIENPPRFPASGPFARIRRLAVTVNGPAYLRQRALIVPSLELDRPEVNAIALPDGRNNWTFPFSGAPSGRPGHTLPIGDLRITDGHIHAVDPKLKSDFHIDIATRQAGEGNPAQLTAQAHGTYANQPITGHFVGGALLTLRDRTNPYPIDLTLANGAIHAVMRGTVQDPLALAGTRLSIELSGKNLADLMPLTGLPAPSTPPFQLTGDVNYADRRIRLDNLVGRVGNSDMEGNIALAPGPERPQVTADLRSRRVDLADFGGLVGAAPGRVNTPGETPEQRAQIRKAEASPYLLPHQPLDLPRLHVADVSLRFRGAHIEGRSMPLDDVVADLTVRNGTMRVHPLSFGVGRGRIIADIAAEHTAAHAIHTRSRIEFREVDLARIMAATHAFSGGGRIGGHGEIEGTGDSIAGIIGEGDGELKLFMTGGDLSALLVSLSGLEFGNALMSALGMPKKTEIRCLVTDFALRRGVLDTRTLLLDTEEANLIGKGTVDLRNETIDYQLRTEPKHFSIGSLPAPIDITGRLKSPTIAPEARNLALRGGLAAALGVLLTPLAALLPTIQLGLGKDNNCAALIEGARRMPNPAAKAGEAR